MKTSWFSSTCVLLNNFWDRMGKRNVMSSFKIFCLLLCICMLPACMSIHHMGGEQKRMKLECRRLWAAMRVLGTKPGSFCKSPKCLSLLIHLSSPILWGFDVSWYQAKEGLTGHFSCFLSFWKFLSLCYPGCQWYIGVCFTIALMGKMTHLSHKSSCCLLGLLSLRSRCLFVCFRGLSALEDGSVHHRLSSSTSVFFPCDA